MRTHSHLLFGSHECTDSFQYNWDSNKLEQPEKPNLSNWTKWSVWTIRPNWSNWSWVSNWPKQVVGGSDPHPMTRTSTSISHGVWVQTGTSRGQLAPPAGLTCAGYCKLAISNRNWSVWSVWSLWAQTDQTDQKFQEFFDMSAAVAQRLDNQCRKFQR